MTNGRAFLVEQLRAQVAESRLVINDFSKWLTREPSPVDILLASHKLFVAAARLEINEELVKELCESAIGLKELAERQRSNVIWLAAVPATVAIPYTDAQRFMHTLKIAVLAELAGGNGLLAQALEMDANEAGQADGSPAS